MSTRPTAQSQKKIPTNSHIYLYYVGEYTTWHCRVWWRWFLCASMVAAQDPNGKGESEKFDFEDTHKPLGYCRIDERRDAQRATLPSRCDRREAHTFPIPPRHRQNPSPSATLFEDSTHGAGGGGGLTPLFSGAGRVRGTMNASASVSSEMEAARRRRHPHVVGDAAMEKVRSDKRAAW